MPDHRRAAGIDGRVRGHRFEQALAARLPGVDLRALESGVGQRHLLVGDPAAELLGFIVRDLGLSGVRAVRAWWVGGLATAGAGDREIPELGLIVPRSKSDVIVALDHDGGVARVGVGVKLCSRPKPTNAQIMFTTATAFCELLVGRGLPVPPGPRAALRAFCGDADFRPGDAQCPVTGRAPGSRLFFDELPQADRTWWAATLTEQQALITRLLLAHAYPDDPLPPTYVLHQRHAGADPSVLPLALYRVGQLVDYSVAFGGFSTRTYRPRGSALFREAPRFGLIQFQRSGQRAHPTQLQFNLRAGYFDLLPEAPVAI